MTDLVAEDPAGRDVVAVAEAARAGRESGSRRPAGVLPAADSRATARASRRRARRHAQFPRRNWCRGLAGLKRVVAMLVSQAFQPDILSVRYRFLGACQAASLTYGVTSGAALARPLSNGGCPHRRRDCRRTKSPADRRPRRADLRQRHVASVFSKLSAFSGATSHTNRVFDSLNSATAGSDLCRGSSTVRRPQPPANAISASATASPPSLKSWHARTSPA